MQALGYALRRLFLLPNHPGIPRTRDTLRRSGDHPRRHCPVLVVENGRSHRVDADVYLLPVEGKPPPPYLAELCVIVLFDAVPVLSPQR